MSALLACLVSGAAIAGSGATSASAQAAAPSTSPLPNPSLEGMEEAVQAQLGEHRELVDAVLRDPGATPEAQARTLGVMGQLYLLHELNETAEAFLEGASERAPDEPTWPYLLGYLQQSQGHLEEAAASFRAVLARQPEDGPSLLRLGQVELARGNLDAAEEVLGQAVSQAGVGAAAHFELGLVALARQSWAAAAEHFEAALERAPSASKVYRPLALVYRRLDRPDDARAALERQGGSPVSFADPRLEELEELSRGASIPLINASMAMARGDAETALREYRIAAERAPEDGEVWRGMGQALARRGDFPAAIAAYERGVELEPEQAAAWYDLGTLRMDAGALDAAIGAFRQALARQPSFTPAWANLAAAQARSGDFAAAADALGELLQLTPDDAESRRRRARALARSSREAEAVREVERVLAQERGDLDLQLLLGDLRLRLREHEPAARAFAAVLTESDARPDAAAHRSAAYLGLARARSRMGDGSGAVAALEAGVGELPADGDLAHALARFLASSPRADLRDDPRALALASAVFTASPSFEHGETLAMALARNGRFGEAAELQERLVAQTEAQGSPASAVTGGLQAARERLETYRRGEAWNRVEL